MGRLLVMACAWAVVGACASPEAVTQSESPTTREYPTGSNIPRKNRDLKAEGVGVGTREDLERIQNSGRVIPGKGPGQTP